MRNFVRTILAGATVTAGILALSSPASAAVTLCSVTGPATADVPSCAQTTVQVLVDGVAGTTVTASDNDNTTSINYEFSSSISLVGGGSGQAGVVAANGGIIGDATFKILNGTSNLITFNLVPLTGPTSPLKATSVIVTSLNTITNISVDRTINLSLNGQNFFGIQATGDDVLTGLSFDFKPEGSGVAALEQFRLNVTQAAAVPEPSTWMLMLLGMAGVGFTMRRKEKQSLRVRYA